MHERDRRLVAYEIHDGLAQQLTAALYKFQAVDASRDADSGAARAMFDEGLRLLHQAMAETRHLIGGLRPPVLDEAGVVAAIDYLLAEHAQDGGPEIEFVHEGDLDRLAPPLKNAVFRIVQECLNNARRHSQSKKVRVEWRAVGGRLRIDVQDWGIGFDPAAVQGEHFGLQGIQNGPACWAAPPRFKRRCSKGPTSPWSFRWSRRRRREPPDHRRSKRSSRTSSGCNLSGPATALPARTSRAEGVLPARAKVTVSGARR